MQRLTRDDGLGAGLVAVLSSSRPREPSIDP